MYQEISRREKLSFIKLGLIIILAAIILITLNTILVNFHLSSSITDLLIIILTVTLTYQMIRTNMTSYKYCLIENELIIWQIVGKHEKRILNMNLNQVKYFINKKDKSNLDNCHLAISSKKKLFNCIHSENRHYLIYQCDDKYHMITIQPTECMSRMIRDRINTSNESTLS